MQEKKIDREPYTGEVLDLTKAATNDDSKTNPKGQPGASSGEPTAAAGFHNRPATRAGPYDLILFLALLLLTLSSWTYFLCPVF